MVRRVRKLYRSISVQRALVSPFANRQQIFLQLQLRLFLSLFISIYLYRPLSLSICTAPFPYNYSGLPFRQQTEDLFSYSSREYFSFSLYICIHLSLYITLSIQNFLSFSFHTQSRYLSCTRPSIQVRLPLVS